jgi:hypothetical protein
VSRSFSANVLKLEVRRPGELGFVDQSSERSRRRTRSSSMLAVVRRVGRHDVLEVAAPDDQEAVEALAAEAADPTLGVSPCPRRPHRRLDHTDTFRAEELAEVPRELRLAGADEEPWAPSSSGRISRSRARWVTHGCGC